MKTFLTLAVACVGLAGFVSTSALAQNPAGPSSATGGHSSVGSNGSTSLDSPAPSASPSETPTKKKHHPKRHHTDSDTTKAQKPAAENPKAGPTATP